MKKTFSLLLVLVFMGFCILPLEARAAEKDIAPLFSLKDYNDKTISLSSFKGKQEVLIFFWASWCAFCRGEIKNLVNRAPELKNKNIELLFINIEEPPKVVKRFFSKNKIDFPVLLDRNGTVTNDYKIVGIPTYIWVDKDGRIKYEGHTFPLEEGK
ncbi:MAG: TlpA disulfide reductase family protein [Candidatus Omnitrophica bacterium]|nr:TlpA disulfide reductase family protein [Candidatus Omnitrophota bacterium]MDD5610291.1 TlpA disulfide reductase family protein [Candidatus Omnitrophota bacterium]